MKELGVLKQLTALPYLPMYIQLINGAIELELFSKLGDWTSAEDFAVKYSLHTENTRCVLGTLDALRFLEKNGECYRHTQESGRDLVKRWQANIGTNLLVSWRSSGMMTSDAKEALLCWSLLL